MKEQSLKEMKPICSWWDMDYATELGMPIAEFERLLMQYKQNPNDVELITYIAFVFYININLTEIDYFYDKEVKGLEEDDCPSLFLELAYETKPCIETIHNFAVFMFTWDGEKEYIEIQRECVALKPTSSIPYKWLAWMLLEHRQYKESVYYFQLALDKAIENHETKNEIYDNLATALCNAGRFQEAINILKTIDGHRNIYAYYNLAFCYAHLRDKKSFLNILEILEKQEYFMSIGYKRIADLYFLWKDYHKTVEYFKKSLNEYSMSHLDACGFRMLYAMYCVDVMQYRQFIGENVQHCLKRIEYTKQMPDNTHVYDYKSSEIKQLKKNIGILEQLEKRFKSGKKADEVGIHEWQKRPVEAEDFGCTAEFFINGF